MKKETVRKKGRITVRAYAKINLSLDVLRKRPDGYHEVEMIMQAVELYDKISVEWGTAEVGQRIEAASNLSYLPVNEDNIACKAAKMMVEIYKPREPLWIKIYMDKHIPVSAGLAGGSADGAAVLRGISRLWGLNLSLAELCSLGEQLGADVPFCLWAQEGLTCALAEGLGERLTPLPPLDCLVLLSKPPLSVSTARVYGKLNLEGISEHAHPDSKGIAEDLKASRSNAPEDLKQIASKMGNLLETVTLSEFPKVRETKEKLLQADRAAAIMMSGSGPTIFGLYSLQEEEAARADYEVMKRKNRETFLRRTWLG